MEKFFCYALLAVTCLSASTQAVEKTLSDSLSRDYEHR